MRQQSTIVDAGTFRALSWLGIAVQAAALVFVVVSNKWNGVPSIAILLVLSILFMVLKDHVPSLLSFLVVLAAMINAGGWAFEWYGLSWFDEFVHFFTSLSVVAATMCSLRRRKWISTDPDRTAFIVWAAGLGLGLGILWEIGEAMFLQLGWVDTVFDLILDTVGAAVGGWIAAWAVRELSTAPAHRSA